MAIEIAQVSWCGRTTPFGPLTVLWSMHQGRPQIRRVVMPWPERSATQTVRTWLAESATASCPEIDSVADGIVACLSGHDCCFDLDRLRLDLCSPFQERVLRAQHQVPRGCVSTYQGIAAHLGQAGGARAVGTALAGNPFPLIIPCHRTIRTDRTLGGYQGGLALKRALLEMEGVRFGAQGRVVSAAHFVG